MTSFDRPIRYLCTHSEHCCDSNSALSWDKVRAPISLRRFGLISERRAEDTSSSIRTIWVIWLIVRELSSCLAFSLMDSSLVPPSCSSPSLKGFESVSKVMSLSFVIFFFHNLIYALYSIFQ